MPAHISTENDAGAVFVLQFRLAAHSMKLSVHEGLVWQRPKKDIDS